MLSRAVATLALAVALASACRTQGARRALLALGCFSIYCSAPLVGEVFDDIEMALLCSSHERSLAIGSLSIYRNTPLVGEIFDNIYI